MSKPTRYVIAALISSLAMATLVLAVVATPLAYADGLGEKCNKNGHPGGNPHDSNEPHGDPHDPPGSGGNPHDIRCR
jgi:hypothetical protein